MIYAALALRLKGPGENQMVRSTHWPIQWAFRVPGRATATLIWQSLIIKYICYSPPGRLPTAPISRGNNHLLSTALGEPGQNTGALWYVRHPCTLQKVQGMSHKTIISRRFSLLFYRLQKCG